MGAYQTYLELQKAAGPSLQPLYTSLLHDPRVLHHPKLRNFLLKNQHDIPEPFALQ